MSERRMQNADIRKQAFSIFAMCSLLCALIIGCGGSSAPAHSYLHSKAIEYNQSGLEALEDGDYSRALSYYFEALRVNQSIENTDGAAVNLINISVIFQKNGKNAEAHEYVDKVFSMGDAGDSIKSEAAYEKARLYLKSNELEKAKSWADKSLSLGKGVAQGSRLNLLGRIAIIEGKPDDALSLLNTGLRLNRENNQKTEEANSLRLIADAHMQKGQYETSKDFYLKALQIDKDSGDSKKIALDLRHLGNLSLRHEKTDEAISFYRRAYNVSISSGDLKKAAEALGLLADAYMKSGDTKNAEEALKNKSLIENR